MQPKGSCSTRLPNLPNGQPQPIPNNPSACPDNTDRTPGWKNGQAWKAFRPTVKTVDCVEAQFSRDNHLGNSDNLLPMTYMFKIPTTTEACETNAAACRCVLRLRCRPQPQQLDRF